MAMAPDHASDAAFSAAFAGTRALITGGLGFIGSSLALRLVALGGELVLLDALLPGAGGNLFNIAPIRGRVRLEQRDLRDTAALPPLLSGCRYVFNLAAQSSHMGSLEDPLADLDINARAQLALLELCRRHVPGATVVFASTRQIYGPPDYLPVDERHPLRPPDMNGISKLAGEAYHLLYHRLYGLETTALRLTNTYGPRMRIKDGRLNFLGLWLRRVIEGEAFEVWEGRQRRDLTYVDDAVDALLLAAITPATRGRAFNIGGPATSLEELARLIVGVNGGGRFETKAFPAERKRIDIGDYFADDALFRRVTGWRPTVSIADGLARSLAYFRSHLAHYL